MVRRLEVEPLFLTQWLHLQRSQWLPRREIVNLQIKAVRALVRHAYSTVPFYRALFKKSGVDPDALNSMDDLRKLPIVTKEYLRALPVSERLSSEFSANDCFLRRTSGSTGVPIEILEEPSVYNFMRAYQLRRFLSYGFRPGQRIVTLDPRRVDKPSRGKVFNPLLTRLFLGSLTNLPMYTNPRDQLAAIKQMRPDWLFGNPSEFRSIANIAETPNPLGINLRGVLTWGEVLDPQTREYLQSRFGAEVYDGYGAVEVAPLGGLAWECRSHGFHVNADCVILEFLKDGEPVAPGERGEVVATSLFRYAMPTIRYALNDYAVPSEEDCSCRRGLPLIKALEGRKVDCLISEDGQLVSPFRIVLALQEIREVGQYQVIQEEHGRLLVNIASELPIPEEERQHVVAICQSLIGKSVAIDVNAVTSIAKIPGKKFQPVVCKVQKH